MFLSCKRPFLGHSWPSTGIERRAFSEIEGPAVMPIRGGKRFRTNAETRQIVTDKNLSILILDFFARLEPSFRFQAST